jgi:hypothetical protein
MCKSESACTKATASELAYRKESLKPSSMASSSRKLFLSETESELLALASQQASESASSWARTFAYE